VHLVTAGTLAHLRTIAPGSDWEVRRFRPNLLLDADPHILRMLIEHHRVDLGSLGREGCVGAYAEVARAGRVEVGERLEADPGQMAPEEAVRTGVAGVVRQLDRNSANR
jgi:hypothetical protein